MNQLRLKGLFLISLKVKRLDQSFLIFTFELFYLLKVDFIYSIILLFLYAQTSELSHAQESKKNLILAIFKIILTKYTI